MDMFIQNQENGKMKHIETMGFKQLKQHRKRSGLKYKIVCAQL